MVPTAAEHDVQDDAAHDSFKDVESLHYSGVHQMPKVPSKSPHAGDNTDGLPWHALVRGSSCGCQAPTD